MAGRISCAPVSLSSSRSAVVILVRMGILDSAVEDIISTGLSMQCGIGSPVGSGFLLYCRLNLGNW